MSTRAVYTFKDACTGAFHVYGHYDGYPSGAAEYLSKAFDKAWHLPRFEADDFAAAFIAVNKERGGGFRIGKAPKFYGDLSYRYEITQSKAAHGNLIVKAYAATYSKEAGENYKLIFSGSLSEFLEFAAKDEAA